jgi:hypothetical protein
LPLVGKKKKEKKKKTMTAITSHCSSLGGPIHRTPGKTQSGTMPCEETDAQTPMEFAFPCNVDNNVQTMGLVLPTFATLGGHLLRLSDFVSTVGRSSTACCRKNIFFVLIFIYYRHETCSYSISQSPPYESRFFLELVRHARQQNTP